MPPTPLPRLLVPARRIGWSKPDISIGGGSGSEGANWTSWQRGTVREHDMFVSHVGVARARCCIVKDRC
eukprot:SAG31_NODE_25056_length_468_cov_82.929539_1_plen_68_part_01